MKRQTKRPQAERKQRRRGASVKTVSKNTKPKRMKALKRKKSVVGKKKVKPKSKPSAARARLKNAAPRDKKTASADGRLALMQGGEVKEAGPSVGPGPQAGRRTTCLLEQLRQKELPLRYNEDLAVLLVRDPRWAYLYWDVASATLEQLRRSYGEGFQQASWVARAYDVSLIHFNGHNAHSFFDTKVSLEVGNWYLRFGLPGTSWCVDLGVTLPDGRFITVLRSNTVFLPLDGPSWLTDEEWMIPEEAFRRLYGMAVGLGCSAGSPVGRLWREKLDQETSSAGWASLRSDVKKAAQKTG